MWIRNLTAGRDGLPSAVPDRLGVRCLGAITRDCLEALRESDAILREEFAKTGLDKKVWQYFTVVPDFAVGVRDNARSMGYMVVIRACSIPLMP